MGIRGFPPYIALVDVLDRPLDFRYRLMGVAVIAENARSLKGRTLRELIDHDPDKREMFDLCERAVQSRNPVFAEVEYENVRGAIKSALIGALPLVAPPKVSSLLIGIFYFDSLSPNPA